MATIPRFVQRTRCLAARVALALAERDTAVVACLESLIRDTGPGLYGTLALLLYLVLGFFVETLSLMVMTIPIVAPVIVAQGFDPVWFGVLLILLIEMALITPPVGLNLYVVQGVRGRGSLHEVMIGVLPYMLLMLAVAGLLVAWPQLALLLPALLG